MKLKMNGETEKTMIVVMVDVMADEATDTETDKVVDEEVDMEVDEVVDAEVDEVVEIGRASCRERV